MLTPEQIAELQQHIISKASSNPVKDIPGTPTGYAQQKAMEDAQRRADYQAQSNVDNKKSGPINEFLKRISGNLNYAMGIK